MCPENPRFDGTLPWGRFIQLLDSTHVSGLTYRHALKGLHCRQQVIARDVPGYG